MADFICLSGDCDNFALTQPGCFSLQDPHGRDWICYEAVDLEPDAAEVILAVKQMQERSHFLGLERDGTHLSVATAMEAEKLPAWLAKV